MGYTPVQVTEEYWLENVIVIRSVIAGLLIKNTSTLSFLDSRALEDQSAYHTIYNQFICLSNAHNDSIGIGMDNIIYNVGHCHCENGEG